MAVRHYNPDDVLLVSQGIPVREFAQGTFITLTFNEDDWVVIEGHHGAILRSKKPNSVAEITFTLVMGSPSNTELSTAANTDRRTGLGAGSFMLKDLNGTSLISAQRSWNKKTPDTKYATEGEPVEWTHTVAGIEDPVLGTNRLV